MLVLCLAIWGCAPALRAPEALPELPTASTDDAAALAERAEALFAMRTTGAVREAAGLWLEAAAADARGTEGFIGAVRARAWLADHEQNAEARRTAARAAVDAGQRCEQRDPTAPECAYWLAIALGVQARESRTTARDGLDHMIERLRSAIERAPSLDHGGPHRVLALLYLRAPGWPTGPGDPDLGLEEAQQAVDLAPDYPPNQLCLAEALTATEDPSGSRRALERAADLARPLAGQGSPEAREWLEQANRGLAGGRPR